MKFGRAVRADFRFVTANIAQDPRNTDLVMIALIAIRLRHPHMVIINKW
jgi:hypothetical protein